MQWSRFIACFLILSFVTQNVVVPSGNSSSVLSQPIKRAVRSTPLDDIGDYGWNVVLVDLSQLKIWRSSPQQKEHDEFLTTSVIRQLKKFALIQVHRRFLSHQDVERKEKEEALIRKASSNSDKKSWVHLTMEPDKVMILDQAVVVILDDIYDLFYVNYLTGTIITTKEEYRKYTDDSKNSRLGRMVQTVSYQESSMNTGLDPVVIQGENGKPEPIINFTSDEKSRVLLFYLSIGYILLSGLLTAIAGIFSWGIFKHLLWITIALSINLAWVLLFNYMLVFVYTANQLFDLYGFQIREFRRDWNRYKKEMEDARGALVMELFGGYPEEEWIEDELAWQL